MKPDTWIADRCVGDFPMIEPFAGYLTSKERGEGVISHGLSGYGYDIRCGFEFKIFTNVNAVEVDPKNIDARAFVTVTVKEGEFIRIPPNSFALAHSLEYLRIPRDVVCLSTPKSTYARCFTGSTRVATLDGENPSFIEMVANPRRRWGIGWSGGEMCATELLAPRLIEKDARLVRVTLDSGETIDCTPDHEFLLRQGGTCAAQDLTPGTSLLPLYQYSTKKGYVQVYAPNRPGNFRGMHVLADDWNLHHGVYSAGEREHRHHIDHNTANNNPTNIARMDRTAHIRMHNGQERIGALHSGHIARLKKIRQDPALWQAFCEKQRQNSLKKPEAARQANAQRLAAYTATDEGRAAYRAGLADFYASPAGEAARHKRKVVMQSRWDSMTADEQRAHVDRLVGSRRVPVTEEQVYEALCKHGSQVKACRALGCTTDILLHFAKTVERWRRKKWEAKKAAKLTTRRTNHKVVAVEPLACREDVFCLTSADSGNFALACGVIVKNCGLIVPTTVLEPSWEGHLTLEISNTTPLPARLYAGEGISQLLFSGADIEMTNDQGEIMTAMRGGSPEGVVNLRRVECETSYADRKGKYQGQRGITLPKV